MKFLLFILTVFFTTLAFSQDLNLSWSDTKEYSKKLDGYHKYFIGTTDEYIYSFSGPNLKATKTAILSHDKVTMQQVSKLELLGYDNDRREADLDGKSYYKTLIIDNTLHIFWRSEYTRKSNEDVEIFVETYDENLKLVDEIRKVKSIDGDKAGSLSILISKGDSRTQKKNGIVIISSYTEGKNEPTYFQVDHFDAQMNDISEEEYKFEIPNSSDGPSTTYGSGYFKFEEDGNLYLNTSLTETTKKGLFRRNYKYYSVISVINVLETTMEITEFRDDRKDIYSLRVVSKPSGNYLMGFFRDLDKDDSGSRTHGIFSAKINVKSGEFDESVFTYFSKEILDNLFQEDSDDRKKSRRISRKKKEREDELNSDAISYNYVIEQTGIAENGDLLLICSTMYNYTVTVCTTNSNGSQSCRDVPYCNKKNVTVFAMSPDGDIDWSKNIDRNITYGGWFIYDIEMVEKNGKYYVIYGGNNTMDLEGLSKREKKEMADRSDNFSYGILDPKDETLEAKTFKIEQISDEKEDQRYVNPTAIRVFDNIFYTNSQVSRQKIGPTVGLCAGSVFCPPLLVLFFVSKDTFKKTTGQLGRIEPID